MTLRVAIVGVGGIGGLVASALAAAPGVELVLCARRAFDELEVEGLDGRRVRSAVRVEVDPRAVAPVDWLLVATKAHQLPDLAPWFFRLCGPETRVVVLQNGIEQEARVRPWIATNPVVPALVHFGAEALAPGRIVMRLHGSVLVPASPDGRAFASLLGSGGLDVREVDDWQTAAWFKLANNVPASTITAALLVRANVVGRLAPLRRWGAALIEECRDVGRREGAELGDDLADEVLDRFASFGDEVVSSAYQDRLRGRPLEHDALAGAVVRAGSRHGVDTRACRDACLLLDELSGRPVGNMELGTRFVGSIEDRRPHG